MTLPSAQDLFDVTSATWPEAGARRFGPWTIREGQGGGKRVSAATANTRVSPVDIAMAESAMADLDQRALFMIRQGEEELDELLAEQGYEIIDPVSLYACPIETLTNEPAPFMGGFSIWPPLAIMEDLWGQGGIGPERIAVMERASGPKTGILGRANERAAGVAFVAIHNRIAMIHAIEIALTLRRVGGANNIMRVAAHWALNQGASYFSLLVTDANRPANALYCKLGLSIVGHYHYRVRQE